jgi:hypothetical protein
MRIESRADERVAVAMMKDLYACPSKMRALQRQWTEEVVGSEVADVFLQVGRHTHTSHLCLCPGPPLQLLIARRPHRRGLGI